MAKPPRQDMKHPGWKVRWDLAGALLANREVFTGPDGTEFVRARNDGRVDVTLETQCGPLNLRQISK